MTSIGTRFRLLGPGLLLALTIGAAARFLSEHYGAPVMLFALLIGIAFHFLADDDKCAPGIAFASRPLLKIGIVLLGARVTFGQIASLGIVPVVMVPVLIVLTTVFGILMARVLSRGVLFGLLTGGAVAICGASAALALSAVLPKSSEGERDTLFTVVAVTTISTLAMIAYPILFGALGFGEEQTGVLLGATIHDVAQVVGAGYGVSDTAGDIATYVKLLRVACLPVIIIGVAFFYRRKSTGDEPNVFPWFAVAFAIVLAVNSFGWLPGFVQSGMEWASRWCLIIAIAALGVRTSLQSLTALGPRHLMVVVAETGFILLLAIGIVAGFMPEG